MNKKGFKLTKKRGVILLTLFIAVILGVVGYRIFSTKNKSIYSKNGKFAIYTKGEGSSALYTLSEYKTIAELVNHGYKFNQTESTCTNGATLNYDSTTKTVGLTTFNATQCNLYFDYYPHEITGTIKAYTAGTYNDGNGTPVGTYGTITEAVEAAGEDGTVELSAGTFAFGNAQYINVDGIRLVGGGMNSTLVTVSQLFSNEIPYERKSLLSINANNITIQGVSFDGGTYGKELVPDKSEATQFNVVRVNSGSTTLNNIFITGSTRTLLSIGTWGDTATSASVIAYNFYAEGENKLYTATNTYADINVVNGTFDFYSGIPNAWIAEDKDTGSGRFTDHSSSLLKITHTEKFMTWTLWSSTVYSTPEHLSKIMFWMFQGAPVKFAADLNDSNNNASITSLVNEAITAINSGDTDFADRMLEMLEYAKNNYSSNTFLTGEYARLYNARYSY